MNRLVLLAVLALALSARAETAYYITLKFKQVSYTLDIFQHIKDAGNSFSITLPTTQKFYDSLNVGQELNGKFKLASFLLSGNLGSRKVIVEKKFTKEEGDINGQH